MRKVMTGVAVAALALGVATVNPAGAGAEESRALAGSHEVSQKNLQFNPFEMTIGVGDTVHWTNNEADATIHSVVQQGGAEINSPDIPPGAHFEWTFDQVGTYTLTCRFHPDMFMTMNVAETTAAPKGAKAEGKKAAGKKAVGKKASKKGPAEKAAKKGAKKETENTPAPPVNHDAHAESAAKSKPAPPPGPPDSTVPGVGGLPISPQTVLQR